MSKESSSHAGDEEFLFGQQNQLLMTYIKFKYKNSWKKDVKLFPQRKTISPGA